MKTSKKDASQDLHIWKQGDDENTVALYTISVGRRSICYALPLDDAMQYLKEHLETMGEEE